MDFLSVSATAQRLSILQQQQKSTTTVVCDKTFVGKSAKENQLKSQGNRN